VAQRTVELSSVRHTDDPLVISRTDGGLRASSPANSPADLNMCHLRGLGPRDYCRTVIKWTCMITGSCPTGS
jgi:hypothetical protein